MTEEVKRVFSFFFLRRSLLFFSLHRFLYLVFSLSLVFFFLAHCMTRETSNVTNNAKQRWIQQDATTKKRAKNEKKPCNRSMFPRESSIAQPSREKRQLLHSLPFRVSTRRARAFSPPRTPSARTYLSPKRRHGVGHGVFFFP